jgi:hypothetical protein
MSAKTVTYARLERLKTLKMRQSRGETLGWFPGSEFDCVHGCLDAEMRQTRSLKTDLQIPAAAYQKLTRRIGICESSDYL